MKKVISVVLTLCLLLSLSFEALAADDNAIYSETEFKDVVISTNGEYAIRFYDGNSVFYQPVARLDVNVANEDDFDLALNNPNISIPVKEEMKRVHDKAVVLKVNNYRMVLFSPFLLEQASPKSSSTSYYTYKGVAMKSERTYLTNISTGYQFIKTGTTAKTVANTVSQIILGVAGANNAIISLGATLLSIFEAAAGNSVVISTANDFTQIELKYDDIKQWTYGKYNGIDWYLGYGSESTTINRIDMYQQFVVNGNGTQKHSYQYPSAVKKSTSFDSPWSMAYQNMGSPVFEWTWYKIYGMSWAF